MEYPWYELITNSSEITQGDIIKNCPVPKLKYNIQEAEQDVDAEIEIIDGIILTQACDIANEKVSHIILCSIISRTDFEKHYSEGGKKPKEAVNRLKEIIKGRQPAYHLINRYESDDFSDDYYIVNFKEIFSVPLDLAKELALSNKKRLRLCPPYREHLSQAFARYFMRVGLPINIHIE